MVSCAVSTSWALMEESILPDGLLGESADGVVIAIEVAPASRREQVVGINQWRQRLQIAVRAPTQKGAANAAVLNVLATALDIPATSLRLVSGEKNKRKLLIVEDLSISELSARILALLEG